MRILWYFAIFAVLLHFTSTIATKPTCTFVPNNNLDCVQYMEFPGSSVGCIQLKDSLVVTDKYKDLAGDMWIKVQQEVGGRTIYIQHKDGICLHNCCGTLEKSKRTFGLLLGLSILEQLQKDYCKTADGSPCVHGNCIPIAFAQTYFCLCNVGYTGKNCEKAIQIFNLNPQDSRTTTTERTTLLLTAIPTSNQNSPDSSTTTTERTTQATIPTTAASHTHATDPCIDNSHVNCADQNVCSSNLKQFCPLSCSLCKPATTPEPCVNNPHVQCSDAGVCSSMLKSFCPESCGLCGNSLTDGLNQITQKSSTSLELTSQSTAWKYVTPAPTDWLYIKAPTTSWLHI